MPDSESLEKPDHTLWSELLNTHVDSLGMVDYGGFISDSTMLNTYLNQLEDNPPSDKWSEDDKLAYWINLYNAATIKLITKHYPIESIKDIGSSLQIPFVNTPWQIEFIKVGDQLYDLDDIEHNIIREYFDEPRIHFALVCAAISCPKLRDEAYIGEKLEAQLTNQGQVFLNDSTKNKITHNHISISKIFWWYGADFKKHSSKVEYLNRYSPKRIYKDADVHYLDYDWRLNKQSQNL